MFKRVLVPTDGSAIAEKAVKYARYLQEEGIANSVILLCVARSISAPSVSSTAVGKRAQLLAEKEAEAILEQARQLFPADSPRVSAVLEKGEAAEVILRYAADKKCDLIIMGNQGRSKWGLLLGTGSNFEKVVRDSPVPVLIVTSKTELPF